MIDSSYQKDKEKNIVLKRYFKDTFGFDRDSN